MEQWTRLTDSGFRLSILPSVNSKSKSLIQYLQKSGIDVNTIKAIYSKPKIYEPSFGELQEFDHIDLLPIYCGECARFYGIRNDLPSIAKLLVTYSRLRVIGPELNDILPSRLEVREQTIAELRINLVRCFRAGKSLSLFCPDCMLKQLQDIYQLSVEKGDIHHYKDAMEEAGTITTTTFKTFLFVMYIGQNFELSNFSPSKQIQPDSEKKFRNRRERRAFLRRQSRERR